MSGKTWSLSTRAMPKSEETIKICRLAAENWDLFKQKVWQGINLDFHGYIWGIILLFHHHCRWHLVRPVSRVESLTERAKTVLTRPAFFFFLLPHKASVQEQLWGKTKKEKKLLTDNNSFSARVFSCCYNDITVRSGTFKAISPGIGGGGSECKNTL